MTGSRKKKKQLQTGTNKIRIDTSLRMVRTKRLLGNGCKDALRGRQLRDQRGTNLCEGDVPPPSERQLGIAGTGTNSKSGLRDLVVRRCDSEGATMFRKHAEHMFGHS